MASKDKALSVDNDRSTEFERDVMLFTDDNYPNRNLNSIMRGVNNEAAELNQAIQTYEVLAAVRAENEPKVGQALYDNAVEHVCEEAADVVICLVDLINRITNGKESLIRVCEDKMEKNFAESEEDANEQSF